MYCCSGPSNLSKRKEGQLGSQPSHMLYIAILMLSVPYSSICDSFLGNFQLYVGKIKAKQIRPQHDEEYLKSNL